VGTVDDVGLLALETSKDLYGKLKHDFQALTKEENSYNYFNFVVTANHLVEWISKDDKLPISFRQRAEEIRSVWQHELIQDMANRGKHFIRKDYIREKQISKDKYIPGFSYEDFSYKDFNYGGPVFVVQYKGKGVDLYKACGHVFNFYTGLFEGEDQAQGWKQNNKV